MAMKCPKCGNQLTQEEVFCGQCGTPISMKPPVPQTEMASMPSPRSGLLKAHHPTTPFTPDQSNGYNPGSSPTSPQTQNTRMPSLPDPTQNPATTHPSGPNRQTGFYHDATEAMSSLPQSTKSQALLPGYPPQEFPGPTRSNYPTPAQFGPQTYPFQTGNYNGPMPTQQRTFAPGQGYNYGTRGQVPVPPQKQSGNPVILVVCITLVVARYPGRLYYTGRRADQCSHHHDTGADESSRCESGGDTNGSTNTVTHSGTNTIAHR